MRDWDAPGHIKDYIARLNAIRRENPALHTMAGLRFYRGGQPARALLRQGSPPTRDNVILVAVNLDPFATHEATLQLPLAELGIAADETYELHELLGGDRRARARRRATPSRSTRASPPRISIASGRWRRRERDFDYYA